MIDFDAFCYAERMKDSVAFELLPARRKNEPCCVTTRNPSMSEPHTAVLAERLKALGDPTRLRMLDLLSQQTEPLCVCDITPHFSQNQPTISHHLRILRHTELIVGEKRGIWSYYWATEGGRRALSAIHTLI